MHMKRSGIARTMHNHCSWWIISEPWIQQLWATSNFLLSHCIAKQHEWYHTWFVSHMHWTISCMREILSLLSPSPFFWHGQVLWQSHSVSTPLHLSLAWPYLLVQSLCCLLCFPACARLPNNRCITLARICKSATWQPPAPLCCPIPASLPQCCCHWF